MNRSIATSFLGCFLALLTPDFAKFRLFFALFWHLHSASTRIWTVLGLARPASWSWNRFWQHGISLNNPQRLVSCWSSPTSRRSQPFSNGAFFAALKYVVSCPSSMCQKFRSSWIDGGRYEVYRSCVIHELSGSVRTVWSLCSATVRLIVERKGCLFYLHYVHVFFLRLEGTAGIVTKRFVVFDDLEASFLLWIVVENVLKVVGRKEDVGRMKYSGNWIWSHGVHCLILIWMCDKIWCINREIHCSGIMSSWSLELFLFILVTSWLPWGLLVVSVMSAIYVVLVDKILKM